MGFLVINGLPSGLCFISVLPDHVRSEKVFKSPPFSSLYSSNSPFSISLHFSIIDLKSKQIEWFVGFYVNGMLLFKVLISCFLHYCLQWHLIFFFFYYPSFLTKMPQRLPIVSYINAKCISFKEAELLTSLTPCWVCVCV